MKRLAAAFAGILAVVGACSSTTAPQPYRAPVAVVQTVVVQRPTLHADGLVRFDQVGDSCTMPDGRSGYLITAGRDLVCSAT